MSDPAFGGGIFIADKSAWTRAHNPVVQEAWAQALRDRQIMTCHITMLELLYSTRTGAEFDEWEADLGLLRCVPTSGRVCRAALTALRELAQHSDGYHRVKPPDALIAASAQEAGVGVLHYDHDFDRLAEVLTFESRWIAPAGSIP